MKYALATMSSLLAFVTMGLPLAVYSADTYQHEVPDVVASKTQQARQLRLENKPDQALAILEPLAKQNPNAFLVHYNLGMAYAAKNDWPAAISELQNAKQINLTNHLQEPTIYNSLGWSYLQSGSYKQALSEFEQAQQPEVFEKLTAESQRKVLNNTGLTWAYLGQPDKATEFYAKANRVGSTSTATQRPPEAPPTPAPK
jgi:tetratricopeptide (TPR) repeat protein